MSLSNLTTSGWVFFAWTLLYALAFVVHVSRRSDHVARTAVILALQVAWLLWLVTP